MRHSKARPADTRAEPIRQQISRFSIYGWVRQVGQAAKGDGPSPTSGPAPVEIEAQRVESST